jgi:hypothetical protein
LGIELTGGKQKLRESNLTGGNRNLTNGNNISTSAYTRALA